MLRFTLLFTLGALAFHQLPELPGWHWLAAEAVAGLALFPLRSLRPWLALSLGFGWSHGYALATEPATLPDDGTVMQVVMDAHVVSLVADSVHGVRFEVEADRIEYGTRSIPGQWRIRLNWRDPPGISTGDRWRLPVRLRAAHGYASPGTWDYEGWLYWRGIRYTGYVDAAREPRRLPAGWCCALNRLRAALVERMNGLAVSPFARGVFRALVVGDSSGLGAEAKRLFRNTGTSHLMAISGLHIGLLAGLGLVGVTWVWRRLPRLCARIPAPVAGAVAGLGAAAVYAALAGLSLPTQRALIMLTVFALGLILRRETNTLHALALAACGVLLWHPPSVISAGFWLSFMAVLAILAAIRLVPRAPRWRIAIRVQFALSLALWPVLSLFGIPASGVAPLVNLLLVPLFGLLIVPLSLLGVAALFVIPAVGQGVLLSLAELLALVEQVLRFATRWPLAGDGLPAPTIGASLVIGVAAVLLLHPPGLPFRGLGLVLLCVPWLPRAPHLAPGDFAVHLLDVGQGASAVIETRHHVLVFDTGPEFSSGFSTAQAVVRPFLRQQGWAGLDRLVLSHGDRDHAGGLRGLVEDIEVRDLQSGEPARIGGGARPCMAGERWRWDGVWFEFLHPEGMTGARGNNASCVLRIENQAGVLLLTGDIEQAVERRLVLAVPDRLRSVVLVAPHHGSRSSSSPPFVAATSPSFVIFTTGWSNRYGFPATEVERRWRESGAETLNTARLGTIGFRFAADGQIHGPRSHRRAAARFWWHGGGSAVRPLAVSSADRAGRLGKGPRGS